MTARVLSFDLWRTAEAAAERLGLYAIHTTEAAEGIPEALEVAPASIPAGTPAGRWAPNWVIYRDTSGRPEYHCDNPKTGDTRTFSTATAALEWIAAERRAGREHCGDDWVALWFAG